MDKIKILLYSLKSTNKEFQDIINDFDKYDSPDEIFDSIFSIQTYTNTDMYNYLSIFELFTTEKSENLYQKIVNLKFFPSEKDTEQIILKYFTVLNKLEINNLDILNSIYSRYIILLNSNLFTNAISNEIFKNLIKFINKNPLFLERSILLLKDQSYKYQLLIDTTEIKYIFSVPTIMLVVLHNTKSKYVIQEYFEDIPKWYFNSLSQNILQFLYYNFDNLEIYMNVAFMYFKSLSIQEIIDISKKECKNQTDNYSINIFIDDTNHITWKSLPLKNNLISLIDKFNQTKDLTDLYQKYEDKSYYLLRYSKNTNLKILGEFICSHKNLKYLSGFTKTFNFKDTDLLTSMRSYLSGFYLVGESQIIHRVLNEFSIKYCEDNKIEDSSFILNISFSLLLLNTKMYNPNVKSKPSFEEYLKDFEEEEFPEYMNIEMLKEMYTSIKNTKLDLPVKNKTNEIHYDIYKKIIYLFNLDDKLSNNFINQTNNIFINLLDKLLINNPDILNTPHDKFIEICKYISWEYIPIYLVYNKDDTYRFLNMFKYYMSYPGEFRIYKLFMNTIKRIENNNKISYLLNRIKKKDNVLPQYKGIYTDIISKDIHENNIKIIKECIESSTCEFIINIFILILEFNIHKVNNINYLDYDSQLYLIERSVSVNHDYLKLIKTSQYSIKLLRQCIENNPRLINKKVVDLFKILNNENEDGFYTMILLQREEDMFDYVINIVISNDFINEDKKNITNKDSLNISDKDNYSINKLDSNINILDNNDITDKDNLNIGKLDITDKDNYKVDNFNDKKISFIERYPINDNTSLFYFYSSSKYILNQSKLKGIFKKGCIRNDNMMDPKILDNRLIYLILKCNILNNKENINYSLWIINIISSSIPIFIRFFTEYIEILEDSILRINIIKIFISRLKKVVSGMFMCCECKYNKIGIVDIFINEIVERNLISMEDIEFWFEWKKEMSKEKRIEEEGGEYIIIYN